MSIGFTLQLSMSSGKFGLTLSRGFKKIGKQIRGKGRLTSRSSDGAPNVAEVAVDGGAEDDSEDEDSTYDVVRIIIYLGQYMFLYLVMV